MKQFLVIQTAFLGDVILCTPILTELKRIYPDSAIDIVVRKGNESLLNNHPSIRTIISWDKKHHKYKDLRRTIHTIRKIKYDEVINLQRYTSAGLMLLFSRATQKIGFDKNKFSFAYSKRVPHQLEEGVHEVNRNLLTIQHHGAQALVRPSLFPSNEDLKKVEPYIKETYFCIAPASVWFTKQVPEHKWLELIDILNKKGTVYLIGAPNDVDLAERLKNGNISVENLCGKLSLLQSAALMQKATMNYVNDSGPMHLASAVNAPTRAFFCSTVPLFGFGPLATNSNIVQVNENLSCRPCGLHGYTSCPEKHFKCGNDLVMKSYL